MAVATAVALRRRSSREEGLSTGREKRGLMEKKGGNKDNIIIKEKYEFCSSSTLL